MKRQRDIERKRNFLIIICMIVLLMSGCQSIAKQEETQGTEASIDAPTVWVTEEPTEESAEEATGESVPDGEEEPPYSVEKGSLFADLPLYTYANFVEHRNMGGAEMLMFSQALTNAGYYQYGTLLEEVGFTCYAENEIEENLFSTWVRDEVVLTAIYINDYTKVHLIAEENVSLPGLPEENVYEEWDIDNLAVQISADYDGQTSNGMCYIYRLCDGSFIIVDSAFRQESCADVIYDTLCRLAPNPDNIVIAAWFLTHAHGDHIGGFSAFSDKYAERVTLEQVIYNYPSVRSFTDLDVTTNHIINTENALANYEDVKVIEAHPGQRFYIRDAEIEMLFTWELLVEPVGYFNDTSLVFTIDLGGERIMQLGDCGPETSQVVLYLYGKSLKSDIVQVAHHGFKGASALLYKRIDADVALWPTVDQSYKSYKDKQNNQPLKEVEEIYLAERLVTVIPLPYTGEGVQTWKAYGE